MEAAGFVIGVAGLASLFSTCVECFDYVDMAPHCEKDFEVLSAKLQIEKIRLWMWGRLVGLNDDGVRGDTLLTVPYIEAGVRANLNVICQIFANSNELMDRYGLRPINTKGATVGLEKSLELQPARRARLQACLPSLFTTGGNATAKQIGIQSRARWAIRDRSKFVILVQDLKDLIDGLNAITPANNARQRRLVEREIESINDPQALELLQEATQNDYPDWSETASAVLGRHTVGSSIQQGIRQWIDTASIPSARASLTDTLEQEPTPSRRRRTSSASNGTDLKNSPEKRDPWRRSRLQRALHRAVKDDRLEDAKAFLRQGAVITDKDDQGNTLCHVFAKTTSNKMATLLLESGIGLESKGEEDATPLVLSAKHGGSEKVLYFIQHGALLEAKDCFARTALSYAAMFNGDHGASCRQLIHHGANFDSRDNLGYTPLHHAASGSDNHCSVDQLLAAKPNLTLRTREGMSVLDLALLSQHSQIAIACIKAGEIIQPLYKDDPCPLTSAAKKEDINREMSRNEYAIIEAAWMGHVDVVEDFLTPGAWDLREYLNVRYEGATLLHIALYRSDIQMLQKLLSHLEKSPWETRGPGGELLTHLNLLNDRDSSGLTPLLVALKTRQILASKEILRCRPRLAINITACRKTASPFGLAFALGDKDLVAAMISKGASQKAQDMIFADILKASEGIAELLSTCDPHDFLPTVNHLGETALHRAAVAGQESLVKLLLGLENGEVDIRAKDKERRTAEEGARIAGYETIACLVYEKTSKKSV